MRSRRVWGKCAGYKAAGLQEFCGNPKDVLTARPAGCVWTEYDEQQLQWALDWCHGLHVYISMPEPGVTWEERIPDEGSLCYDSQVFILHP